MNSRIQLPHQPTSNTLHTKHKDLIHDLAYDYYGKMLATCSGDQTIKIFKLINNKWSEIQEIRHSQSTNGHTHKSAIRHICWAHPVFGSIIATVSVDKTINIFELSLTEKRQPFNVRNSPNITMNDNHLNINNNHKDQSFEFVRTAYFTESIDIICCEFSPHHLGLKLAIVCGDGIIKIMEARDITKLSEWMLAQQIIIHQSIMPPFNMLPFNASKYSKHKNNNNRNRRNDQFGNNRLDRDQRQLLDSQLNQNTKIYCISWNSSKWEFPSFCVGANNNRIFIYGYTVNNDNTLDLDKNKMKRYQTMNSIGNCAFHKTWNCIEKIVIQSNNNRKFDVRGISWANHMARKHHLIACGCSDGFVRIIKITRNANRFQKGDNKQKVAFVWNVIFESNEHHASVWRVKWNVTATSLLSAGDDGKVYLWRKDRIRNIYVANCLTEKVKNDGNKPQRQQRGSVDIEQNEMDDDGGFGGFGNQQNKNQGFGAFGGASDKQEAPVFGGFGNDNNNLFGNNNKNAGDNQEFGGFGRKQSNDNPPFGVNSNNNNLFGNSNDKDNNQQFKGFGNSQSNDNQPFGGNDNNLFGNNNDKNDQIMNDKPSGGFEMNQDSNDNLFGNANDNKGFGGFGSNSNNNFDFAAKNDNDNNNGSVFTTFNNPSFGDDQEVDHKSDVMRDAKEEDEEKLIAEEPLVPTKGGDVATDQAFGGFGSNNNNNWGFGGEMSGSGGFGAFGGNDDNNNKNDDGDNNANLGFSWNFAGNDDGNNNNTNDGGFQFGAFDSGNKDDSNDKNNGFNFGGFK